MRAMFTCLLSVLLLPACETVRTVYDENGNEVLEADRSGGGEQDLMSAFEKRIDASFSEKKGPDGVPVAQSSRVSSFQKELDRARTADKEFRTGRFDAGRRSNLREQVYDGFSGQFEGASRTFDRTAGAKEYDRNLRPDFMDASSHGISHAENRFSVDSSRRSSLEGQATGEDVRARIFATPGSPYATTEVNTYVDSRRDKTPQPTIMDHRDYYRKGRYKTRALLGRDEEFAPAP